MCWRGDLCRQFWRRRSEDRRVGNECRSRGDWSSDVCSSDLIVRQCVAEYGRHCGLLVTLEDHVLAGGFGSAVLETLNALELAVPVVRVGWPDQFIEQGKVEALRQKYGLTAEAALERARPHLAAMGSRRMALQ